MRSSAPEAIAELCALDAARRAAIQTQVARMAGDGLRVLPEQPPAREVSTDVRHNLFLIVKEALNNVVRHAQAGTVRLQIAITPATLDLLIEDDGRGIERETQDGLGDGLRNMRQRAEELKAQFTLESKPGAGTRLTFRYPWPAGR